MWLGGKTPISRSDMGVRPIVTDSTIRVMALARLPKRREIGAAAPRARKALMNTPSTRAANCLEVNSQKKVLM